jgi:hypothetical protein
MMAAHAEDHLQAVIQVLERGSMLKRTFQKIIWRNSLRRYLRLRKRMKNSLDLLAKKIYLKLTGVPSKEWQT